MFTGIIQTTGTAVFNGSILTVTFIDEIPGGVKNGDSIAINGVCLTVIGFDVDKKAISFFVMEETVKKTMFDLTNKDAFEVNIERALRNNEALDGHIVQGHVHETGVITAINENLDGSKYIAIRCGHKDKLRYKDSITVNGVSLTIADVTDNCFKISLIPYTLQKTTFGTSKVGDYVNIEYNIAPEQTVKNHEYFMNLAYQESKKGRLTTAPNPWVGCVIVYQQQVIGKGFHLKAGTAHAEVKAIEDVIRNGEKEHLQESTLYVTLEPCHHFEGKRTPACDNIIVKHQIKNVVIGILDPDSNVSGLGEQMLRDHGVNVTVGVLKEKITKSLRSYIHHRQTKQPYVIIKTALSLDGYPCLKNNDAKWITSSKTRQHAHKIRAQSQAIIVGKNTILADDPRLDVRLPNLSKEFKQPLRVVIDQYGKIKSEKNILDSSIANTLFVTSEHVERDTPDFWTSKGADFEILNFRDGKLVLAELLEVLGKRGILQCLIEGGPFLHNKFHINDLFQELHIYYGNVLLGKNGKNWLNQENSLVNNIPRLHLEKSKTIENDVFIKYSRVPKIVTQTNVDKVLDDLKHGKAVILMDDKTRENEGDLVVGAEFMTSELCTFFITNTSGIICVPMEEKRAKILGLPKMVANNEDPNGTPFTVTCDHKDTKTGVSAIERTLTITKLADPNSIKSDFCRPGHICPLIAAKGGIYERKGHTEGSIELCKLAGIKPVAAIAELMNKDGTMMDYDDCRHFAEEHNISMTTMQELEQYIRLNKSLRVISSCELELDNCGAWELLCYATEPTETPHRVLIKGNIYDSSDPIVVRVHSECFTGDVLGSLMCDCGDQLKLAMRMINEVGTGVIIFPANHEGRGIGLHNKVLAYRKMKNSNYKINTYEANKLLNLPEDARNYDCVVDILNDLGVSKIDLLTDNIDKISVLKSKINRIIPLKCKPTAFNGSYLKVKEERNNSASLKPLNPLQNKIDYVNNVLDANIAEENNYKIGLIYTVWNGDILDDFVEQIERHLMKLNIKPDNIKKYVVPGAFEIPVLANNILRANKDRLDVLICVGAIIKGDTAHFEYISSATIVGLMDIQIKLNFPIINGILNCYTKDQAIERCQDQSGLAKSLVSSALHMIKAVDR